MMKGEFVNDTQFGRAMNKLGIRAQHKDNIYEVMPFIKPKQNKKNEIKETTKSKKIYKPPQDHYFKQGQSKFKKLTFEESDKDILNMLEEIFFKRHA